MIIVTVAGLAGLISSILGLVDAWAGTATQRAHEIEDSIESWKDTDGGSDIFSDTFSFKVQSLDYADDFYAVSEVIARTPEEFAATAASPLERNIDNKFH